MSELQVVGAAYARMSTEMQNEKSPEDQVRVRRARAGAEGVVIPDSNVFIDRAVSGTKPDRNALAELRAAAKAKRFSVLFFEDLSRLSRESTHLMALLKQLVFDGVRIISVNEGIDSSNESWHILATILGLQHEQYVRDLGHRVRRGQAGTVLEGLSAGDLCLGYTSEPVPGTENGKRGRKRRPRMQVKKVPEMVRWVLQIFIWFAVERKSMHWIADELTRGKVPKDHRSTTEGWHHTYVRRILTNEKYIAIWTWGRRRNRRNPTTGKVKQVAAPADEVIVRERPELRIVPQRLWDLAQARLKEIKKSYPGPKRTADRSGASYVDHYPKHELSGLLNCESCGSRFITAGSNGLYMACGGQRKRRCEVRTMVPRSRMRGLLLAALRDCVIESKDQVDELVQAVQAAVQAASIDESQTMPALDAELRQVRASIRNLTKVAETGYGTPEAIAQRMTELEERRRDLERQLRDLIARRDAPVVLPDRAWVVEQLEHLNAWLQEDKRDLAAVFRAFTGGRIVMTEVKAAGRKRGHFRATFRAGAAEVLCASSWAGPTDDPRSTLVQPYLAGIEPAEVAIDVVPPSRAEVITDEVYRLRQEGHQWKDIRRQLRCGHATVHEAYEIALRRVGGC